MLYVGPGARWFAVGDGPVCSLETRAVLRRLLTALVQAHPSAAPSSSEQLVACTWPGEVMRRSSAQNRLSVALSTLRAMGLGALILRVPGGWLLQPSARVVRAHALAPTRPNWPRRGDG